MIRTISGDAWNRYKALLPKTRELYVPALPIDLPYQGNIQGNFDYVLPDEELSRLRKWLESRGEETVYYFKTEGVEGEPANFEVEVTELTHDNLSEINRHAENVIVGRDFSWAIFVDHEGFLHVSGPVELMRVMTSPQVQQD